MRPLIALVVAVIILGSVEAYVQFHKSLPKPQAVQSRFQLAEGKFSVDLTPTFEARPDEFDLDPASVLVELHGKELFRSRDVVKQGEPIVIDEVPGVAEGSNSFYIKVAPGNQGSSAMRAVRVRVLRDGQSVAEQTLWSEPGAPVEGVVEVLVPRSRQAAHPHEH